ncbi:ABC transporter permease [Paenibacillus xylaniclasticus]|uniref:ABC transporter permease n=1 Tax=Paenibacillus xylaniclasticus TaxID=588083 RepID=UPI000FDAE6EA|nr:MULTISPECIES: ABC transporter permease [Paenibacillus]GFN32887.1 hypothetical protein PCURB6_31470 [Paenibacillus curdlanolyticus]
MHNVSEVRPGIGRVWIELSILLRIQLAIVRDQWVIVLLMATIFPLSTLLSMKFMFGAATDQIMVNIIAGNIVFAVIMMGFNALGQEISWQKHQGYFTYYASLPIQKVNFVLAQMLRGLMTTMPSVMIMALAGEYLFNVHLRYEWGLIPIFILAVLSMVGIGAGIGFWSPNHQTTSNLVQGLMMFIGFLSPVMMEREQLPFILQWIGYVFPTTYAASALRGMLTEGWTWEVSVNALVMFMFVVLSYWFIFKMIRWRAAD